MPVFKGSADMVEATSKRILLTDNSPSVCSVQATKPSCAHVVATCQKCVKVSVEEWVEKKWTEV